MNIYNKIKQWYGHIPLFETQKFYDFVGKSFVFADVLLQENYSVQFTQTETAFYKYDDKHEIHLSSGVLTKEYFQNNFDFEPDEYWSIGLINAFIIHEALHGKYTYPITSPLGLAKLNRKNLNKHVDVNLISTICNIIEDIYIEYEGKKEAFGFFLEVPYVFMFSEDKLDDVVENEQHLESMIFFKNINLRNHCYFVDDPIGSEVSKLLYEAEKETDIQKRHIISWKIYDILILGEEFINTSKKTTSVWVEKGDEFLDGFSVSPDNKSIDISIKNDFNKRQKLYRIVNKINNELDEQIKGFLNDPSNYKFSSKNEPETIVVDVTDLQYQESNVEFVQEFGDFAKYIINIRTPKTIKGVAKKRGRISNTDIYRIATDSRVCRKKTQETGIKNIEISLLVDASGSMGGFYDEVLDVAYTIFISLRNARIPISVLSHTTKSSDDNPYIIKIASYNMAYKNSVDIEQYFSNAKKIHQKNNADGIAILEASKMFTARNYKKFIIVLSDGLPAYGFCGKNDSIQHTKETIDNLRRKGVEIYSFSIKQDVVKNNNFIYGENFNINAVNLNIEIQKLMKRII